MTNLKRINVQARNRIRILGEINDEVQDAFDDVSSYFQKALKKDGLIYEETHEPEEYDDGEYTAIIAFSKKIVPSVSIVIAGNIHLKFDGNNVEEGRVELDMANLSIGKHKEFIEEGIATIDLKFDNKNEVKSHRIEWY